MTPPQTPTENAPDPRRLPDGPHDFAIFTLGVDGGVVTWNAGAERLLGYTAAEAIGQPLEMFYTPEDVAAGQPRRALQAAAEQGALHAEALRVRNDGSRFWAAVDTTALRDEAGQLTGYANLTREVSERQRAEAALSEREERARLLDNASPNGVLLVAEDGRVTWANTRAQQLFDYPPGQLVGLAIDRLVPERFQPVHPQHRAAFNNDRRMRPMGAGRDLFGQRRDGSEFPVEIGLNPITTPEGRLTLVLVIDITQRKQGEAALRRQYVELEQRVAERNAELAASEAKQRALLQVLPVGVSVLDAQRHIVESNPGLARILKLPPDGLSPEALARRRYIRPDGSPMPPEEFASVRAFEEQRPALGVETGIVTESGETVWTLVSAAPLPADQPGVVVVTADITARKRAEQALVDGQRRYRELFEEASRQTQQLTLRDLMHETLAREADPREVIRSLVEGIAQSFGYGLVSLYLLQGEWLRLQHQVGYAQVIDTVHISQGVSGRVVRTGQPVLLEDAHSDPAFMGAIEGIQSEICVPLFDQGKVAGTLNLESTHGVRLNEADLQTMVALGKQVELALERARLVRLARESQQRFSSAFNYARIGMALVSPQGHWLEVNPALCRLVGYSEAELLTMSFQQITHPDDLENDLTQLQQTLAGEIQSYQMEKRYFHKDGHIVWILLSVSLVRDAEGTPLYFISQIQDITERRRAEQALAHERDLMQALMDNMPDTIYFKDRASRFTRINRAQAEFLGLAGPEAAVGLTDLDFQARALAQEIFDEEQRLMETGQPLLNRVDQVPGADGQTHWLASNKVPLREAGRVVGLVGVSRDISALKQAEAQLLASLQEKDVLLKEIHHRVKNNLQIVSSLLHLQAETLDDPRLREAFDESQRRVRTMALIHEQLYRSSDLARIDFGEYLDGLFNYLRQSQGRLGGYLQARVPAHTITLGIDQAIPLGLMVNELVTNSLKYGFPPGSAPAGGVIWVEAVPEAGGQLTVRVGDNGAGLPDSLDLENPASMGLQLVQSFVKQLRGRMRVQRKPGTVYTVTLPIR